MFFDKVCDTTPLSIYISLRLGRKLQLCKNTSLIIPLLFHSQEKRKLEREERKKARDEARAKAKAESQEAKTTNREEYNSSGTEMASYTVLEKSDQGVAKSLSLASVASVEVVYQQGLAGTGQPYVEYPQLGLSFYAFFALGSPIGMFLTVR